MTDEIIRTGCDEEEYVAIPKSEYEHLKAVKANYIAELENRRVRLMDELNIARQICINHQSLKSSLGLTTD